MAKLSADFRQRLRDAAHRMGLPAFWGWWTGQLVPLIPAAPRAAFRRRTMRPVLAFAQDAAVLWMPRNGNGTLAYEASAPIPLAGDPAAVQTAGRAVIGALPKVVHGAGPAVAKVVVSLPAGQVLRKEIRLPAAVEQDLTQTLAYDLDRHTPFKPDELYFDTAIVGRDARKGEIRVDWAAALRGTVADARRRAESWGAMVVAVTPDAVGGAGPALAGGSRLNLLPPAERPALPWWRRWRLWAPLAALAVVVAVAIVLPIWQKRGYVIALIQVTDQMRVQADAASALRQQLETMTENYNYVLGRKYGFPSQVQVLEDVTKLLPDDTWITQLEVKTTKGKEPRRELLLRGESANAGRLVSLLEESKVFVEAAPRSPTTKIQPGPGEIFDLGAQLSPTPRPEPLLLASTPTDAAAPATPAPAPEAASAPVIVPGAPAAATSAPASAPAAPPAPPAPPAAAPGAVAPAGGTLPAPITSPAPQAAAPPAAADAKEAPVPESSDAPAPRRLRRPCRRRSLPRRSPRHPAVPAQPSRIRGSRQR